MKIILTLTISLLCVTTLSRSVFGFCGFYVAKADTKLFNKASQVVIARDGEKTVITMTNDFKGDPKEFAIVIPVPTLLEKGQIHIGNKKIIEHIDAYSSPPLVEYFDRNPCAPMPAENAWSKFASRSDEKISYDNSLGVVIEAKYTVGEYDIVILSARDSKGLEVWLTNNGYKIPEGASDILGSYKKQNMRFFVAKVNLNEHSKLGFS